MTYEEAIKSINALNAVCGKKDFYDAVLYWPCHLTNLAASGML